MNQTKVRELVLCRRLKYSTSGGTIMLEASQIKYLLGDFIAIVNSNHCIIFT